MAVCPTRVEVVLAENSDRRARRRPASTARRRRSTAESSTKRWLSPCPSPRGASSRADRHRVLPRACRRALSRVLQVMAASKKKDVRLTITLEAPSEGLRRARHVPLHVPGAPRPSNPKRRRRPAASARIKTHFHAKPYRLGLWSFHASIREDRGAANAPPRATRRVCAPPPHPRRRSREFPPAAFHPPEREPTTLPLSPSCSKNAEPPQHLRAPGADEAQPLPLPTPSTASSSGGVLPSAGAWWVGVGWSRDGTGSPSAAMTHCFRHDSFVGV